MTRLAAFVALLSTVVAANWALNTFGVVPIGFGLAAPAGVFFAGLAFGLRDILHEAGGRQWVLAAIAAGALLSALVAPTFALASAVAFGVSELADLLVYEPLRERQLVAAVVASNLVGALVDSVLFLWLAFGSLDHLTGQVIGKAYMILPALLVLALLRHRQAVTV
jgi:uncharacterized PurR-regulated membrane protein YhhQ (DUF165 family)